jgi:hypothetical protein
MNKRDIDFSKSSSTKKVKNGDLFLMDNFYYKIFKNPINTGHYIVDGFNLVYSGIDTLSCIKVGFINEITCSAFYDIILDDEENCCGYVTYKGEPIENSDDRYLKFVNEVATFSSKINFAHSDLSAGNVIVYKDKCSIIDLDSSMVKLRHGRSMNQTEKEFWIKGHFKCPVYIKKLQDLGSL